jgi:hypothetical protein
MLKAQQAILSRRIPPDKNKNMEKVPATVGYVSPRPESRVTRQKHSIAHLLLPVHSNLGRAFGLSNSKV